MECHHYYYYKDKAVYLLDDPLAAVDAHVAKHLFNECIMGLLRHKTRILNTHHVKYVLEADHVIVMDEGEIVRQGKRLHFNLMIIVLDECTLMCKLSITRSNRCLVVRSSISDIARGKLQRKRTSRIHRE